MENEKSIDDLTSEKINEFCSTTIRMHRLNIAINMHSRFGKNKLLREAWKAVRDIVEHPLSYGDKNHFTKVEEVLGPRIALELYKSYLMMCEKKKVVPGYLKTQQEVINYIQKLNLTVDEFCELDALQGRLEQLKAQR